MNRIKTTLISRLFGAPDFKLALNGTALSIVAALLVFGIIYRATEGAERRTLDAVVVADVADIFSDMHDDHKTIVAEVNGELAEGQGTFYALYGTEGNRLAGNLAIPATVRRHWQSWLTIGRGNGIGLPSHVTAVRGLVVKLADGRLLYVAENATGLAALNRLIVWTFLGIFGVTLLISLAGGTMVARASLMRIEAISRTSQRIIEGDFDRRILLTGSGDAYDNLAGNLNAMLDRIQFLMENLRHVTNDIAHDLRSPLARLRAGLELARLQTSDPAMLTALDDAGNQVDGCLNIFSAMLRIAEIEAGARRRNFALLDLSALCKELADTYEVVAEANGQIIAAAVRQDIMFNGDRELLTQMLVNCIENAIQHALPGARIVVGLDSSATGVEIYVADTGPGIPRADWNRVIGRFAKLDPARHSAGNGLGMPLIVAVAELHGGRMKLEDGNPGLRIEISLPNSNACSP